MAANSAAGAGAGFFFRVPVQLCLVQLLYPGRSASQFEITLLTVAGQHKIKKMDEYLILMRLDLITKSAQPSPEQLQVYMQQYHRWVDSIAAKNQFVGGKGLSTEGKVIRFNRVVTDGPFAEVKESLAGFITIRAANLDDAVSIASECPILNGEGNSVEVRKLTGKDER